MNQAINAYQASLELVELTRRINALDDAHNYLWDDFNMRPESLVLKEISDELRARHTEIVERLEATQI